MVAPALLRVIFIIRVTPRSHGPRMLSSVTRAKSRPKQPTTNCIQYPWGPLTHEALRALGSGRVLSTPLVLGITRVAWWLKRVSFPWLLWNCTRHYDPTACLMRERIFASFRSKQANFIRAVTRCECTKQISYRQYNSVVVTALNWTKRNVLCASETDKLAGTYHTWIFLILLLHPTCNNAPHQWTPFQGVACRTVRNLLHGIGWTVMKWTWK